jgi:hypothetical protein
MLLLLPVDRCHYKFGHYVVTIYYLWTGVITDEANPSNSTDTPLFLSVTFSTILTAFTVEFTFRTKCTINTFYK